MEKISIIGNILVVLAVITAIYKVSKNTGFKFNNVKMYSISLVFLAISNIFSSLYSFGILKFSNPYSLDAVALAVSFFFMFFAHNKISSLPTHRRVHLNANNVISSAMFPMIFIAVCIVLLQFQKAEFFIAWGVIALIATIACYRTALYIFGDSFNKYLLTFKKYNKTLIAVNCVSMFAFLSQHVDNNYLKLAALLFFVATAVAVYKSAANISEAMVYWPPESHKTK